MSHDYWDYYDEEFDWDDSGELVRPDLTLTREKLKAAGMSESEADE